MKHITTLYILAALLVIINCNEAPESSVFEIHRLESPSDSSSSFPYLFAGNKTMWMSWVETRDTVAALKYAALEEGQWGAAKEICRGNDWFVNWADFPAITENKGHLLSHILQKSSEGTYSYDVQLSLRAAGEAEWVNNLPLHTDGTFTEHGFVSSVPYKEGFFATWLDGRNTVEQADGSRGAMSIRAAEIRANGEVQNSTMLDARTCDCCQTTAAITANGPVVLYRDRSDVEVRDISIVRQVDGVWTAPQPVHDDGWKINGCPVNGPKAAAMGNTLAVAWFTGAAESSAVKLAFSTDGGAEFDDPFVLDSIDAIGRVDVVLIDENAAIASWMGSDGENAAIYAKRVARDGTSGPTRIIAALDASRRTGFPQMELLAGTVYFAWTDAGAERSTVQCAYASAELF